MRLGNFTDLWGLTRAIERAFPLSAAEIRMLEVREELGHYEGSGDPENAVVGDIGDTFQRRDGGAGTSFYVKEADSGLDTGWVGK
jgi:hypothetical protein